MRIEHLSEFIHLAQGGSFNATAKKLHVSQSALSNHIMAIEKYAGATLINRESPTSLTPQGEIFLRHAQEALRQLEIARKECRESLRNTMGTVRVMLPLYSGVTFDKLYKAVTDFKAAYPSVRFEISRDRAEVDLVSAVSSGALDCGLLT